MTILESGEDLVSALNTIYDKRETASIAALVLKYITGYSASERLIYKKQKLTAEQGKILNSYKQRLLKYEPVQYVLHETWFAGMKFYVDENVLIPRPETEELAEIIIEDNKKINQNISVLDIGTGSGCIAIALKKKLPHATVYALDTSQKALDIAKKNSVNNEVSIQFFEHDILKPDTDKAFPIFDVIASNPPYIKNSEAVAMSPNVLDYEPHIALFVPGNDALLFYKAIADFSLQHLNKNSGKIYVEVNETMADVVATLFKQKGFGNIEIKKDMQQKNRFVKAHIKIYK